MLQRVQLLLTRSQRRRVVFFYVVFIVCCDPVVRYDVFLLALFLMSYECLLLDIGVM